jgi:hypothetical protein
LHKSKPKDRPGHIRLPKPNGNSWKSFPFKSIVVPTNLLGLKYSIVKTLLFTIPNKGIVMCRSPQANTANLLEEENRRKLHQMETPRK